MMCVLKQTVDTESPVMRPVSRSSKCLRQMTGSCCFCCFRRSWPSCSKDQRYNINRVYAYISQAVDFQVYLISWMSTQILLQNLWLLCDFVELTVAVYNLLEMMGFTGKSWLSSHNNMNTSQCHHIF